MQSTLNNIFFYVFLIMFLQTNLILAQRDTTIYSGDSSIALRGLMKNKKKIGIWFESSKYTKRLLRKLEYFPNDSADVREYDPSTGRLKEKYYIMLKTNDKEEIVGKYEAYYSSGNISRKGLFKEGKGEGEWNVFFENGKLNHVNHYLSGKLDGEWIEFYENGKIKEKGKFKKDFKIGEWIEYYENGTVKSSGKYCPGFNLIHYSETTIDSLKKINVDVNQITFPITNYFKDDLWKYFDLKGAVQKREKWKCGKKQIS